MIILIGFNRLYSIYEKETFNIIIIYFYLTCDTIDLVIQIILLLMMKVFQTRGKLVYDPSRVASQFGQREIAFKKTHKQRTMILQLPMDQLDLYYQWHIRAKHGSWLRLQRPMYGLHVTVVKGYEQIADQFFHHWRQHADETVVIEYEPLTLDRHFSFGQFRWFSMND